MILKWLYHLMPTEREQIGVACWALAMLLVGYLLQTLGRGHDCAVCRVLWRPCDECRK